MKTNKAIRAVHATALMLLAASASQVAAQQFPDKPIRVISAFPTGISPDLTMRILAEKLTKQMGTQVFVDPKPGGNGFIAVSALKQSPADGYTLLLISNAHVAINPSLFKNLPYKVETDFDPVATIYRAPFFIATSATGPNQNLAQILSRAKTPEGRVSYSIPYVGSPPHLGSAALEYMSGGKMLAVPYKDGGVLPVATGEVDFSMLSLGSLNAMTKAGRIKLLAIAMPQRSPLEPTVPTVEEAGGPKGLTVQSWTGLVAPRGTPAAVIARLNDEIAKALASPDLIEKYKDDGVLASATTPADMAVLIRNDAKTSAELIKSIGMQQLD